MTLELDGALTESKENKFGAMSQHREVEGHESGDLLALFPAGISCVTGGHASLQEGSAPRAKLFHIKGRKSVHVTQVRRLVMALIPRLYMAHFLFHPVVSVPSCVLPFMLFKLIELCLHNVGQVEPYSVRSLNTGDVFILVSGDGKHLFQWNGHESSESEKLKGMEVRVWHVASMASVAGAA